MDGLETTLEVDPQEGVAPAPPDDKPEDKPADKPADKAADGSNAAILEELKQLRQDVKQSRRSAREAEETARYWMTQARQGHTPAQPKPEAAAPSTKVDLVEALTNNDHAKIAQAMRDLGLVTREELEQTAQGIRAGSAQDAKLYAKFPDLEDEDSDFFKRTAEIYNDLARDPNMAKSGRLAEVAARMADRELHGGDGDRRGRRQPDREVDDQVDDDEDREEAAERERERVDRVRRQSGGRTQAPPARRPENSDNDELDSMQKTIVAKLRAAGADITEDGYRKRARAGVRMAGMPARRPR